MSDSEIDMPSLDRRTSFRDVLAIREFRALFLVQALSILGDQLARIAVAVIIFDRTGSAFLSALTYAVSYLSWLIGGPLLSGYADRMPARKVMIRAELARTIAILLMTVPAVPDSALILLVTLASFGEPPFESARSAVIPDIVGSGERLNAAFTLTSTTYQLAAVLGFAVAGGLVETLGTRPTLLIDATTFALSALTVARYVHHRPAADPDPKPKGRLSDSITGFQTVFRDAQLRWLVVTTWLVLGASVSVEAAAIPYSHDHGRGGGTAGLLIATLPLGIVVGALVLGRLVPLQAAERLMLPLALITPLILAVTAVNPSPQIAAVLWFVAGIASAMTVTANRLFIQLVPREVRGRAFGIAVTGIAAFQGIYSLFTGLIAGSAGPAKAISDLSLPTFALLVLFSLASASFRSTKSKPIPRGRTDDPEDRPMPARTRSPALRVWALNLVLCAVALAVTPLFHGEHAYVGVRVNIIWLFAFFAVAQLYPLHVEVSRKSIEVVLETVPLVLGLIYLSPVELILLRAGASAMIAVTVERAPWVKRVFNTASLAVATLAASETFRALVTPGSGIHPSIWPASFAAVVASELIAGLLLLIVLLLTSGSSQLARTIRVIGIGVGIGIVVTSLALFTAASLAYDTATAWVISIFFVLALASAQASHRAAETGKALDGLYAVARELGPIATEPGDLAPALVQLRQIMRAGVLELAVSTHAELDFVSVVTVAQDLDSGSDSVTVEQRPLEGGLVSLLANSTLDHRWWRTIKAKLTDKKTDRASASVSAGGRDFGVLTATIGPNHAVSFSRGDLRLLDAAADQLAVALDKGRLMESLRRAAELDTLTGLANLDSLRSFLDTSLQGSHSGVLILLNIVRFREVNEMLGHDAGDEVLAQVARRLESAPMQGALVARLGGDQFAIAVPGAAGSEVARLAAMAVKSRIDGAVRLSDGNADVRVTVGIARAPDHGTDSATLLRRAEMAMVVAKDATSGIGEWEPNYEREGSRRLQLLTALRLAVVDGSLRVDYQPKLSLNSGEVTGFEALVRWNHPELGPISPAEFVPIAESAGLISALTSTVLRTALSTCRSWHDAGKPVGVAVNISARSLDDDVLVGQVAAMLTASGLESRWLTLEITESSVMEDHERSLSILEQLRRLGVRLSIDDFGTGYSSLHQLRGLPVNEVKIDKSFVDSVDSDEAGRAVVDAIVKLCDSLSLTTVAEGVETASQVFALEGLGVGQVQGYFHGRPMSVDAALAWLIERPTASLAAS